MKSILLKALIAAAAIVAPIAAQGAVRITEFMYKGAGSGAGADREFFEITNLGSAAVDITSWYYDDESNTPSVAFGASFGMLAANESIIVTEMSAAAFRTLWGLDASVRIYGSNSVNLGNGDTINIYSSNSAASLVDSVSFGSTTAGVSRNLSNGGTFVASSLGDAYGSVESTLASNSTRDLANPGRYPAAPTAAVPEPATWAMMIGGFALLGASVRRTRKVSFA